MNKHVQIRNIAESKHRKLKARAAAQGMTITDYVERLIDRDLAKLTWAEIAERAHTLPPVNMKETSAETVRAVRDEH